MANNTKRTNGKTPDDLALLTLICRALDEKKAEDMTVLDVAGLSSITNYLLIATATSEPHLRALRNEVDAVIKETGTAIVGIEAGAGSGWAVVDAFDVMVHLVLPEVRERYKLEILWGDARRIELEKLIPAAVASAAS